MTPEEIQERDTAIASAAGSWAIIRKGKRDKMAILIDPTGKQIAAQSAPWGVRGRGRW